MTQREVTAQTVTVFQSCQGGRCLSGERRMIAEVMISCDLVNLMSLCGPQIVFQGIGEGENGP